MNSETLLGQSLGPYQIESLVGRGGMAVVYQARHQQGDVVALKVLTLPAAMGDELLARFQREAETTARLNHPAIVSVLDVGQAEGHVYLAMPLIAGQNLSDMLRERGPLSEANAIDIAWQMADALHYAHSQGIVHRDVKPSNILVTQEGRAMLTDFGVALALDAPSLTRTGHTVGTPAYMAPEQASGQEAVGGRADLYSLGVVLYHMVTGKLPFQGTTPQIMYGHVHQPPPSPAEIAHISPALDAVILKALTKAVDQRYQSGTAFAQALTLIDAQDNPTQLVLEPTTAPFALSSPTRKPSRLRWLLGSMAVLLTILFMGMTRPLLSPASSPPTATSAASADEVVAFVTETPTPAPTATPLPFPAGSLLQGSGNGLFRLHDDGSVQHIYDWPTYLTFGFDPDEIRLTEDALLDELFQGEQLTRLLQTDSGAIDWVIKGQRWRITHWQETLARTGYLSHPASRADTTLLNRLPLKVALNELPEGTLVQEGDNLHRLFDERLLRRFTSPDLVAAYGYEAEPIIDLPAEVRHLYRNGSPLTELLQAEGDQAIYRLENGQRRLMPTGDALWALGYGIEDISQVSTAFMDGFPLGEPFEPPSTPTPEPTASPTATPTVTPTTTPCPQPLPDSFNRDLAPDFYAQLGCPLGEPIITLAARQQFQHGFMLWRQDQLLVYAVTTDTLTLVEDSWQHTVDIDYDPNLTPPQAGLIQPVRGFGKVWRNNDGVQTGLGWAITQEDGFEATIQPFTNGFAWQGEEDDFVTLILTGGGYTLLGEGE